MVRIAQVVQRNSGCTPARHSKADQGKQKHAAKSNTIGEDEEAHS